MTTFGYPPLCDVQGCFQRMAFAGLIAGVPVRCCAEHEPEVRKRIDALDEVERLRGVLASIAGASATPCRDEQTERVWEMAVDALGWRKP